jgi:predicted glycoside hydrolase/deacetylase ChbG (UPF0249 family)
VIRLVVNADDLGLHPAIDDGIFRAHREGIVSSVSLLVTGRTAIDAVARAMAQRLGIGVHLCLSSGLRPALPAEEVRSLAPQGVFRPSWAELTVAWARGRIRIDEVERELRAQLHRARQLGVAPDHFDGHQHVHLLPGIAEVVRRIADEEQLPVRWPRERASLRWLGAPSAGFKSALLSGLAIAYRRRPRRLLHALGVFSSGALDEPRLLEIIDRLHKGDHELICHPGEPPGVVPEDPAWRYGWSTELAALCSPRVLERVRGRGIQLTTYRQLFSTG